MKLPQIIIVMLWLLTPVAIAPTQGHPAAEIEGGTFGTGNFSFVDSIFIASKLGIGVSQTGYKLEMGAGNLKLGGNLLDSTGSVIFNDATKKIPAAALPYEQGDITSDAATNSWAGGYYDVASLAAANVKQGVNFGRGQTGTLAPTVGTAQALTASAGDVAAGQIFFGSGDNDWSPTTGTLTLSGNAVAGNVVAGSTFYSNSFTKQTGTLALTGDASPAEVASGKTFYKNSLTKQTGTLALTGDASQGDVLSGKTFYGNSLTKQTGTLALTGNAATGNVVAGSTFYSNSFTKQTGTLALTGDASPADVATGKSFYGNSFTKQTGTATSGARYVVDTADKCNYIHTGDTCNSPESKRCYLFTDCEKTVGSYSGGMYSDHEDRVVHTEADGTTWCRCTGGNNAAYWDYYEPCLVCP